MTAKKMLHGREFKISCGRFDRKISVEVDGKPAEKVDGALFRVALADGKYLQFRVEGSYMTGMNLIEGNVTLEVFRHISCTNICSSSDRCCFWASARLSGLTRRK